MSRSSAATQRQFWRSDWFVGVCIIATWLVLWMSTGWSIAAAAPAASTPGHASATGYDAAAQGAPAGDDHLARTAVFRNPAGAGDAGFRAGQGQSESGA